jgi:hypothetical protein
MNQPALPRESHCQALRYVLKSRARIYKPLIRRRSFPEKLDTNNSVRIGFPGFTVDRFSDTFALV